MSKKVQFVAAYNNLPANTTRKDALVILAAACGLSPAGASTYYANVKSGKWSTTEEAKPVKVAKVKIVAAPSITVAPTPSNEPDTTTVIGGVKIEETGDRVVVNGVVLNDLSGPDLCAMYNLHVNDVTKHVNKFRTKADGIKRIVNLLCE